MRQSRFGEILEALEKDPFGLQRPKPRAVSDEAYLLACQIMHVDPGEPEDTIKRNSEYWLWHRFSMVQWAKRALTFPVDMLYSGFPDPTSHVGEV